MGRPKANHVNHAAAFLEYAKGASLEDIAHALVIPLDYLKRWRQDEQWDSIAPQMSALVTLPQKMAMAEADAERGQRRIQENRERNLRIAATLQEDLLTIVNKLHDGTLRSKRVFANGLQVEIEPTLRDRCDLALYARNVAEASYRALGDIEASKNALPESASGSAGQITIVLPALLAAPREKAAYDIESEVVVIDVQSPPAEGNGSPNRSAPESNPLKTKGADGLGGRQSPAPDTRPAPPPPPNTPIRASTPPRQESGGG